jgi:hypothetical protein
LHRGSATKADVTLQAELPTADKGPGELRLGKPDVGDPIPENVNQDGSIIVGAVYGVPEFSRAFVWDKVHGQRDLRELLIDNGLGDVLGDWILREANGISADGRVIVGWGLNPAGLRQSWIVRLVPEPGLGALIGPAMMLMRNWIRRR